MNITVSVTFLAVIKLFLISLGGYLLVRLKVFSKDGVNELAKMVLYLTVPTLLFTKVFASFTPSLLLKLGVIPLGTLALVILAGALGFLGLWLLPISEKDRGPFLAMMIFGNTGYIPIPLVMSILPEEQASQAVFYISLFLLAFSPLLWTLGVYLIGHRKTEKMPLSRFVSPPVVGILLGILCASIPPLRFFLRHQGAFLVESCNMLGTATVPLAMILIGGAIASLEPGRIFNWPVMGGLIALRMLLFPALVIFLLSLVPLPAMIRFIIALEAMVPPATNLIIIAKTYDSPGDLLSLSLFVTYLLSIITIPLFLLVTTNLFPLG